MTNKRVLTRSRRSSHDISKSFAFTKQMLPVLQENGKSPVPVSVIEYALGAWDTYESIEIPTTKMEAWRRTDLKELQAATFRIPTQKDIGILPAPPIDILKPLTGEKHGGQVVITPGGSTIWLEPELQEIGVIFTDLHDAFKNYPGLLEKVFGKVVDPGEGKFAALAGAMSSQGIFVYIPPGVHIPKPLHSVFWGPGNDLAYFSHILVYLDRGASLTYVHEAASPEEKDSQTMHAGIVEIIVDDGANLRFVELQSWGEHVWNFSHERARVNRDANLDWIFGAIGSRLTKNFSDLDLIGEGASGKMSGFYFTDHDQHLDHDTQQNHLAPNTTSDLLFKGALKDQSRSVWQGMIYVAPGAQKTDGYQANRNLVLSKKARADSIPGLEILG
jgi:Fe-S cluster assembly protein SufD